MATQTLQVNRGSTELLSSAALPFKNDYDHIHIESRSSFWNHTISNIMKAVVQIRFAHPERFDGQLAVSSQATGFVVDKDKGYILTNRHVTGVGPFYGYAIFQNHEACEVNVVYADPMHDYAFLQYDPAKLKFTADLKAPPLRPDLAQIAMDVRCVGHDSGMGVSVGSGTISRLDAEVLQLATNTHLIQASVAMVGGSSGSPLVDVHGNVLGMMVGGSPANSVCCFWPMQRIKRALELLRRDQRVPRGSLKATWSSISYTKCEDRGLDQEQVDIMRKAKPHERTMLTIIWVLPEHTASGHLQVGDLVSQVNNKVNPSIFEIEEVLDDNVNKDIFIRVWRRGKVVELTLKVYSMKELCPGRYLKFGSMTLQDISLITAMRHNIPQVGLLCSDAGFATDMRDDLIVSAIDNHDTPCLDSVIEILQSGSFDNSVSISFFDPMRPDVKREAFLPTQPSLWPDALFFQRTGLYEWTCNKLPVTVKSIPATIVHFVEDKPEELWWKKPSIQTPVVYVTCMMPIPVDGYGLTGQVKKGVGLIVDTAACLVLISRATVPHAMVEVTIEVNHIEVPGRVCFLHPLHGYALLRYTSAQDRKSETPGRLKLSTKRARVNDEITQTIMNQGHSSISTKATITRITTPRLQRFPLTPYFKACNFDTIEIDSGIVASETGVLLNSQGQSVGVHINFQTDDLDDALIRAIHGEPTVEDPKAIGQGLGFAILHATEIAIVVEHVKRSTAMRFIAFEHKRISFEMAHKRGLNTATTAALSSRCRDKVVYTVGETIDGVLESQDILLTLDGKLVVDASQMGKPYTSSTVQATILRQRNVVDVELPTISVTDAETTRAVLFCGMVLQRPHLRIRRMITELPSEIYINSIMPGSPAELHEVQVRSFITHVNDMPVSNIDGFLEIVKVIPDRTAFRLALTNFSRLQSVVEVKRYGPYFPTKIYDIVDEKLRCVEVS